MRNELEILTNINFNCLCKRQAIKIQNYAAAASYRDIEKKYINDLFEFLFLTQPEGNNKYYNKEKKLQEYYSEKYGMDFTSLELIRHLKLEMII